MLQFILKRSHLICTLNLVSIRNPTLGSNELRRTYNHTETSKLICIADELTDFYMMETLAFYRLITLNVFLFLFTETIILRKILFKCFKKKLTLVDWLFAPAPFPVYDWKIWFINSLRLLYWGTFDGFPELLFFLEDCGFSSSREVLELLVLLSA